MTVFPGVFVITIITKVFLYFNCFYLLIPSDILVSKFDVLSIPRTYVGFIGKEATISSLVAGLFQLQTELYLHL